MESPQTRLSPEVLEGLCRRDGDAMEAFFEHYFDRIYGYIHRVVGNASDAEDIAQTAFMKMHRAIATLDKDRDPTPWVFTVAANTIRDFWRSRRKRESKLESTLDHHPHALGLVDYQTPETDFQTMDLLAQVERSLSTMSENLRSVILLRDLEGLSYPEIAQALDIEEATARKRHSRAIGELRALLRHEPQADRDIL